MKLRDLYVIRTDMFDPQVYVYLVDKLYGIGFMDYDTYSGDFLEFHPATDHGYNKMSVKAFNKTMDIKTIDKELFDKMKDDIIIPERHRRAMIGYLFE